MGKTVRSTLTSVTPTPAKIMASALMESIHIPANAQLIGLERIAKMPEMRARTLCVRMEALAKI